MSSPREFSEKITKLLQEGSRSKLKQAKRLWKAERAVSDLPSWREMEHVGFDPLLAARLYGMQPEPGARYVVALEEYHDTAVEMVETHLGGDFDLDRLKMALNIRFYMEAGQLEYFFLQKCENCDVWEKDLGEEKNLFKCSRCQTTLYCSKACQVQHWRAQHKTQCIKKNRQPKESENKTHGTR